MAPMRRFFVEHEHQTDVHRARGSSENIRVQNGLPVK